MPSYHEMHEMHETCNAKLDPAIAEIVLSPFCCNSVIPGSFRHLFSILPQSKTYFALARPVSSTPILTSFLSYVVAPTPPRLADKVRGNTYFAIVQVTQVSLNAETNGKEEIREIHSNFFEQDLSQHQMNCEDERNYTSDQQEDTVKIMGMPNPQDGDPTERYYVAIENSGESTVLDQECRIMGKTWREVDKIKRRKSWLLRPRFGCHAWMLRKNNTGLTLKG